MYTLRPIGGHSLSIPLIVLQNTQASLTALFIGKQRQSKLFYTYESLTVTMLSGKKTGKLGVESIAAASGRSFSATNLERTLVDLTVRPAYAGGIVAALECFRVAKAPRINGKASTNPEPA